VASPYHAELELPSPTLADFTVIRQLASHHGVSTYAAMRPCGLGVDRQVLLKITEATLQFGFSSARQLADESRLGERLTHPNLLQTIEHGKDKGCVYQVREWVEGVGLRRLLEGVWQDGGFPVAAALHIAEQLCRALTYLHELNAPPWAPDGLVHHGLVPSNIIISTAGEVRLGNLFQAQPRGAGIPSPALSGATHAGQDDAPSAYHAPERCSGQAADPRSDIFALGTLLYESIVGPEALGGDPSSDWQRVRDDREVLRKLEGDQIPSELSDLLTRAMASNPFERYGSAAALQHDILAALQNQPDDGESQLRALATKHYQPL